MSIKPIDILNKHEDEYVSEIIKSISEIEEMIADKYDVTTNKIVYRVPVKMVPYIDIIKTVFSDEWTVSYNEWEKILTLSILQRIINDFNMRVTKRVKLEYTKKPVSAIITPENIQDNDQHNEHHRVIDLGDN